MRLLSILPLLLLSYSAWSFQLIQEKVTNFPLNYSGLEKDNAQMSIVFYTPDSFKRTNLSSFDLERWSDLDDTQLIFVKGAFIVNRPITYFTPQFFSNNQSIKRIYDADNVFQMGPDQFKVEVSRVGVSMDFLLQLDYEMNGTSSSRELKRTNKELLDIADGLDRSVPAAERAQIIQQYQFSKIFTKSITVNKLIPYGEQTLVVSFSLARAKQSSVDKINSIPFVNAQKTLSSQLKDSFKATYKLMAK